MLSRRPLQGARPVRAERLWITMDATLTQDELHWLRQLDTDSPLKPELPPNAGERLVELGYAIHLVEGGFQLTAFGREALARATAPDQANTGGARKLP